MKVGIDGSRLRAKATGVGRYTEGILAPLDKLMPDSTFVVYARRELGVTLPSDRWSVRRDRHPIWSRLPTTYWIHYRLGSLTRADGLDVLWAPNTLIPRGDSKIAPCVATVLDFRHIFAPQDLPPITRRAYVKWADEDVRRACRVVAISEGTSARMLALLGRRADAIALPAIPPLPSITNREQASRSLAAYDVRQPFLLTVGGSPCKNLASVVDAVTRLKARGRLPNHQLIMAGAVAWYEKNRAKVQANNSGWIKPIGYVDDTILSALYSLADALVFPSFYEGFGIPVAEARALGCRVVTTDSPELHEAGGAEAVYVDPTPEGIIAGLDVALSQPAPLPRELDRNWDDAAKVMSEVFRRITIQS